MHCRDCPNAQEKILNCVGAGAEVIVSLRLLGRFGSQTGPGGGAVHGHQVHQRRVPERPGPSGQRLPRRGHGPPSAATLPVLAT